jgi:hypothetical protein
MVINFAGSQVVTFVIMKLTAFWLGTKVSQRCDDCQNWSLCPIGRNQTKHILHLSNPFQYYLISRTAGTLVCWLDCCWPVHSFLLPSPADISTSNDCVCVYTRMYDVYTSYLTNTRYINLRCLVTPLRDVNPVLERALFSTHASLGKRPVHRLA